MTTPNTDLTEQIAQALSDSVGGWNKDTQAIQRSAAAVLPIVDAAVKRGQAEALRDAAKGYGPAQISGMFLGPIGYTKEWLGRRADQIEKETPDEQ